MQLWHYGREKYAFVGTTVQKAERRVKQSKHFILYSTR